MENTWKSTLLGISEKRQKYIVCFRQTEESLMFYFRCNYKAMQYN